MANLWVAVAVCCLAALAGCEVTNDEQVGKPIPLHDDERAVTCWTYYRGEGLSCLPDWMLTAPRGK